MYSSVFRSWFFFLAVLRHKCSRLTIKQTGTKNWHLQTESNRSQFLFLPCHNWGAWNHVWLYSFYYRVLNPSHRKCLIYVFISPQYVWEDLHLTPVSGWRGPFLPCDGRSPHAPLPPPGWWKHHRTASPQWFQSKT